MELADDVQRVSGKRTNGTAIMCKENLSKKTLCLKIRRQHK